MDKKTALGIMNLEETATLAEAKKAYRSLAKQYHPDVIKKNPSLKTDPEARMKDINLAFRYLVPLLKLNRPVNHSSASIPDDAPVKKQPGEIKKKGLDIFFKKCGAFLNRLFLPRDKPSDVEKSKPGTPKKRVQSKTVFMSDYQKYTQLKQKMKFGRSRNPNMPVGRVTKIDPVDRIGAIKND
jgi:DnaJ domain